MPLRILHLLSSSFFAGSVAYALQLAEKQSELGHEVYMATDKEGLSDKICCIRLPVSDRSLLRRIENIVALRRIVRDHDISVIHAHSRAASWLAHYALHSTRTPHISTVHGRQRKHSSLKADVYGEMVIAICPELREHLVNEIGMGPQRITILPNPLDLAGLRKVSRQRTDGRFIISVVGRLNGPKGDHIATVVAEVFPKLLNDFPQLCLQIVGGEWDSFPSRGKEAFNRLKDQFSERIIYIGFTSQIAQIMADSDLVIGAGRIAMEALAMNIPIFALGEACCHGLLKSENLPAAIGTNFGDILSLPTPFAPDVAAISDELFHFASKMIPGGQGESPAVAHYEHVEETDLRKTVNSFDLNRIMPAIMKIYSTAIMKKLSPQPIPVLMYHRVLERPITTRHRTFVTIENFIRHLRFFSMRGLQSITFKDYLAFSRGERPLAEFPARPFIITFDDGYRDNCRNMLPLAKKFGYKGVLFLLGDSTATVNFWDVGEDIEANRLMNLEEKKKFVDAGWEIGAHTLTHPHLTQLNDDKVLNELLESKKLIEQELQTEVISFAYPFGSYDNRIKELTQQAGFEFGISTDSGGITIEEDRFAVFRVNIFPDESLFSLFKKTSSWYRKYYLRKRGK